MRNSGSQEMSEIDLQKGVVVGMTLIQCNYADLCKRNVAVLGVFFIVSKL